MTQVQEQKANKLRKALAMPGISKEEKAIYENALNKLLASSKISAPKNKPESKVRVVKSAPKQTRIPIKDGRKTVGFIVDKGAEGWGYAFGLPSARSSIVFSGDKSPLTKAQAEARVRESVSATKTPAKRATPKENYKEKYKGVFGDYDGDGILNVDDPNPSKPGDKETVEEVKLSDEIAALIEFRETQDEKRVKFVKLLEEKTRGEDEVLSRTKTPYSIINKLRRKRLTGAKGITDMVGTMVVFDTHKELEAFKTKVNNGTFGKVVEFDDYYKNPQAGYKAYHWNVVFEGAPVEIQAKTTRMKKIASANHELYKTGKQSTANLLAMTDVMELADKGSKTASATIDSILKSDELIKKYLLETKLAMPAGADGQLARVGGKKQSPRKKKAASKPQPRKTTPETKSKLSKAGAKGKMQSLLNRALRGEFKDAPQSRVLEIAKQFQSARAKWGDRDAKRDGKQRLSPTPENLIRWMKRPGSFDLIGVDTYRKNDPTANLKIKKEIWWNRLGIKFKPE